jgi:predicted phosphodiesterase
MSSSVAVVPTMGDVLMSGLSWLVLDGQHRDPHHLLYVCFPHTTYIKTSHDQIPPQPPNHTRIVVVSDTHDRHRELAKMIPKCDLFVHCGDILVTGRLWSNKTIMTKLIDFNRWLCDIPATKRIVVGGNHDQQLASLGTSNVQRLLTGCSYLENSATQFGPLSIWGTPVSGGSSPNRAFQSRDYLRQTLEQCPPQVDILITHGTVEAVEETVHHRLHLCGHNHNSYGIYHKNRRFQVSSGRLHRVLSICAPVHDGRFRLRHVPVVIDMPNRNEYSTTDQHVSNTQCSLHHYPIHEFVGTSRRPLVNRNDETSAVQQLQSFRRVESVAGSSCHHADLAHRHRPICLEPCDGDQLLSGSNKDLRSARK